YGLGAYATMVELLSPLFTQGFDQPPALRSVDAQAWTASTLALAFDNLDDEAQAQRLYAVTNRLNLQNRDARNVANCLSNLGSSFEDEGRLASAEQAYQLSLTLAQAAHEQQKIDIAYESLVGLFAITGNWA